MRVTWVLFLFAATQAFASMPRNELPNKLYSGDLSYIVDGQEEVQEIQTVVIMHNNKMLTGLLFEEEIVSFTLDFSFNEQGYFDVLFENNIVGQGFCTENQCQYEADINENHYAETIMFVHGDLFRAGSKTSPEKSLRFEGFFTGFKKEGFYPVPGPVMPPPPGMEPPAPWPET